MDIRAISLDLDDTLWPIDPIIERIESSVDCWLRSNCPEVASAWPIPAMRALRDEVTRLHPELSHDFAAQRRLTLRRAFAPFNLGEDWVERTYAIYVRVRNEVDCYADTAPALAAMAAQVPLISISNGTADLGLIGLHKHFRFSVSAGELGIAKPDAGIFMHACERLGIAPEHVLHVGDDPMTDVAGARAAGMRTAWINRNGARWTDATAPDIEISDLDALAAWLLQHKNTTRIPPP